LNAWVTSVIVKAGDRVTVAHSDNWCEKISGKRNFGNEKENKYRQARKGS